MRPKTLFFIPAVIIPILSALIINYSASPTSACAYDAEVTTAAKKAKLPSKVVVAIMKAESSCNPLAVDETGKARGLFQIEEDTWKRFSDLPFSKAFDPHENIKVAIKYLKAAKSKKPKVLASWHNAGTRRWWKLAKKWTTKHPNKIYRKIYQGKIT